MMYNAKVVILQKRLTHYRKPLFEILRKRLMQQGIELVVIYSQPLGEANNAEMAQNDWEIPVVNKEFKMGSVRMLWQPCLHLLKGADLIIAEQASKLLLNYWLFLQQPFVHAKFCLWGHGKNFQEHNVSKLGETLKKVMSRNVHWWFAYNQLSVNVVRSLGFPRDKITNVQNAIDTRALIEVYNSTDNDDNHFIKQTLGISSENICIYTGSIYAEKRIDFLLEACVKIRGLLPDFEMIFIGDGPEQKKVQEAAKKHNWIHYAGPKFGADKVSYFKMSKLLLMPGLVGLAVVDAFALETPLVTTNINYHSPEISYLKDGENGVVVQKTDDILFYAHTVVDLLTNTVQLEKLKKGCRMAKQEYTIENMASRFADGIIKALAHKLN